MKKEEVKIVRKSIHLDPDLHKRLSYLSIDLGKPINELISEAVQDYLKKHPGTH